MKREQKILNSAIVAAVLLLPTVKRKPSAGFWAGFLILNAISNIFLDKALVKKGYLSYPVRKLPRVFKINIIYDWFICPYISVWYCQSTSRSGLKGIIGKVFYFAIPQILLEVWWEKKTHLLEYKKMKFSQIIPLIFAVKFAARIYLIPYRYLYDKISSKFNTVKVRETERAA